MRDPLTIQAGELRFTVQLQQQSAARDAHGQQTETWTTVLQTRSSINTLSLVERANASGFTSQASHRMKMRYQSAVPLSAGMRLVHGATTYLIESVENVKMRNRVLVILALEINPVQ